MKISAYGSNSLEDRVCFRMRGDDNLLPEDKSGWTHIGDTEADPNNDSFGMILQSISQGDGVFTTKISSIAEIIDLCC